MAVEPKSAEGVEDQLELDKQAEMNEYQRTQGYDPENSEIKPKVEFDERIMNQIKLNIKKAQERAELEKQQVKTPPKPSRYTKYKEKAVEYAKEGGKIALKSASLIANEMVKPAPKQKAKKQKARKTSAYAAGMAAAQAQMQAPPQQQLPRMPRAPRKESPYDSGMYTGSMNSTQPINNSPAYDSGWYTKPKQGTPSLPMQGNAYDSGWYTQRKGSAPQFTGNAWDSGMYTGRSRTQTAPDNRSAVEQLFGNKLARMSNTAPAKHSSAHMGGLSVLHAASTGQYKAGYKQKPKNPSKLYKPNRK